MNIFIYSKMTFDKGTQMKRIASSTNGAGITGHPHTKE